MVGSSLVIFAFLGVLLAEIYVFRYLNGESVPGVNTEPNGHVSNTAAENAEPETGSDESIPRDTGQSRCPSCGTRAESDVYTYCATCLHRLQ